jgi:hypothetical protein
MSESTDKRGRLKNNLWFAYIVFLTLWTGCVYTELARWNTKHELFAKIIDHHPYVSDFVNVYNSACLAAACHKEKIDIYSPSLQAEYEKKLTAPVVAEQPFYLQYPPFLFALVRPLALFDMLTAWLVWCSMGMALLVASAICLTRTSAVFETEEEVPSGNAGKIFGINKFTLAFVIMATVASFPTWLSIELGQTSLLLVPGLVAFWLLCKKQHYFYAGLASGVVLIKLQYLPPVFIIGFIIGRWRYLGGFTAIGVALLALSVLTLGLDNVMRFPQALSAGESGHGVSGVAADEMQNLRGNLTLILGSDSSMVHIISIAAFALALCVLAFLWWRASKTWWQAKKLESAGDKSDGAIEDKSAATSLFRILASISTLILLVVSPHCHTQDYLALVVPCIWLWFEITKLEASDKTAKAVNGGKPSKGLAFLKGMILLFPLLGWPFFVLRIFFQLAKIQPFFIWAVIVIILSYRLYVDMQRQAEGTNS